MTLTTDQLEGKIVAALSTIRDLWEDMLTPPTRRLGTRGGGGGALLADDAEVTATETWLDAALMDAPDLPRSTNLGDVRAAATTALNGWCRTIVDDHDVHHGIPHGQDVPGMCEFLLRWRAQAAESDGAQVMLEELRKVASSVRRYAEPEGRSGLRLGACPLTWQDPETAQDRPCPGRLVGMDDGWVTCSGCGTRAVPEWWEQRAQGGDLVPAEDRTVTAAELVDLARDEFGQRIAPAAVWQWVKRGRLVPVDKDAKPHRYPLRDVVVLLMRRAG